MIKSGIIDLQDEIKRMSKEKMEKKKHDKILNFFEEILKFNQQNN